MCGKLFQLVSSRASRQVSHSLMRSAVLALLTLVGMNVGAQPEIHRCAQADGTIAFQEMPCPEPMPADNADDGDTDDDSDREGLAPVDNFFDFDNPYDQSADLSALSEPAPDAPVSEARAACEKTARDAIDAIDLEMRKRYTKEQGQRYLAELLTLTQRLRACRQL